jgi:hypothetical protein
MKLPFPVFWLLPVSLALLAATPLRADDPAAPPARRARTSPVFTLYFENDAFGGEDQHYTNGFKFSWLSADLATWGQAGWRKSFLESLPFVNRPDTQKNFGIALGQNIYTPQNIRLIKPDASDRPYAGWSYLEFSFISKSQTRMDTFSVQAGMVGPASGAEQFQHVVHEWLNSARAAGWDYQLKDEFGLNLIYEREWRLYARTLGQAFGADLIPHLGASLGNVQTFANAGLTVRLGYHLPSDFGVSLIRGGALPNGPLDDNDPRVRARFSLFVFAGVDGRAVARDIFLDGNTFQDSRSVDKEPFVGDGFYGVGVGLGRWQLTYTAAVRTREYKRQPDNSYFGSFTLSRAF